MSRDSLGKRLGAVLLGIVLALALAEGLLQIAALVVRHQARQSRPLTTAPPSGGPVVLCVGDSFTYGSGSSSAAMSYPGQLQTWLNTHDSARPWVVRNAGWPGRNSSELLRRLPGFLQQTRPQFLCVLVGLNNRWSHRDADETPADSTSATSGAGEAAANVRADSNGASAAAPSDASEERFTWRLPRLLAIVKAAVRQRLAAGHPAPAAPAAPQGATTTADGPIDLSDPVAALRTIRERRGTTADVRALLEALEQVRPRIRALNDPQASVALVLLLSDTNQYAAAVAEGDSTKQRYGMTPALANALVQPLARLGRTAEAVTLGRVAVADAPQDLDRLRRLASALRMDRQTAEPLAIFTRIYEANGDQAEFEKQLRKLDRSFLSSPERCDSVLASLHLPDARRSADLQLIRSVFAEVGVYQDVLPRDLARILDVAAEAGARPVVVGYPSPDPANATLRQAAEDKGVAYVDVEAAFRQIPEKERLGYFVLDGHCNDRGYAVMAEAVGRALTAPPPVGDRGALGR